MRKIIIVTAVAVVVSCFACGSLISAQLPPNQEPLQLVEAGTGAAIQNVLIMSMYTASVGISTGGGHALAECRTKSHWRGRSSTVTAIPSR